MAFLNFYSKKWSETTRSHQSVTGLQGENNKEENKIENVTRDEEITHAPSPKTFWVDKFNRFANLQDAKEVQRERLIESQHQKHKCHDSPKSSACQQQKDRFPTNRIWKNLQSVAQSRIHLFPRF